MSRFFIDMNDIHDDVIQIKGEDVSHIKKVLRLRCGDNIVLCDGMGKDYLVSIKESGQDCITTEVISSQPAGTESSLEITLYQGIPKSDKMDFIIQKSIELGIRRIVPVSTERTIVKIDDIKDAGKKVERWQKIALEAAKQCNRGMIPQIEMPVTFDGALELCRQADLAIIPYEKETESRLRSCISSAHPRTVAVMIGPEGGFSEKEIEKAVTSGVRSVTLGPRILRTETAGIAVISILMYELGDVG